jgi:two-component sensor histidine kinase
VAAPTLARLAVASWVEGVPYLPYFPAILLAALFLGWRWGAAVVFASAAAANLLFFPPHVLTGVGFFIVTALLIVATAAMLRSALRELTAATEREAALNAELQHRVKNNLAVVQGLAAQTVRTAPEGDNFYDAFRGRLLALADAHNLLSTGKWEQCHLPALAEAALRPFASSGAVSFTGPPCRLPAGACVPLVLALHELAVNAVKYGALSVATGRVRLAWALRGGRAELRWEEGGGPAVRPPARRGLGSRLLTRQAGLEAVSLEFRPAGVVCEIVVEGAEALG